MNNSDKIFFNQQGLTIKLAKHPKIMSEAVMDEMESKENDDHVSNLKSHNSFYYVNLIWEDCNKNSTVEAIDQSEGYYTFGDKGYEKIKARGFKKLIYKDFYPNIDVEYSIPENKTGIEYRLIVHPGADLSKVKMHYTGDVNKIKHDKNGNIQIITPVGSITDHAPKTYFLSKDTIFLKDSIHSIPSNFTLKNNTVQFNLLSTKHHALGTDLIIDSWTTTPDSMITDNFALDIDFDDAGDVYISGGTTPYKLTKYSPSGKYLWTFDFPSDWSISGSQWYSKFCLLPASGSVFIGEGVGGNGPRVMKIDSYGFLVLTSNDFIGTEEIWVMFYNRCNGSLIGFGGGITYPNNMQMISDTNLMAGKALNFDGSDTARNDVASVVEDVNGDFYAYVTGKNPAQFNNHIVKSLSSSGYAPPPAFNILSDYNYLEYVNTDLSYLYPNITVRANILALNSSYLFSYDAKTLKVWNKSTGLILDSIVVNANYSAGVARTHDGIVVDECNNVYVGGTDRVHVYYFNGTNFTTQPYINNNINGEVYVESGALPLDVVLMQVSPPDAHGFVSCWARRWTARSQRFAAPRS